MSKPPSSWHLDQHMEECIVAVAVSGVGASIDVEAEPHCCYQRAWPSFLAVSLHDATAQVTTLQFPLGHCAPPKCTGTVGWSRMSSLLLAFTLLCALSTCDDANGARPWERPCLPSASAPASHPSPKSAVTQLQELICFDLSFSSSFKKFQENSHFVFLRLLE